jgi:hypothetical protein
VKAALVLGTRSQRVVKELLDISRLLWLLK